MTFLLLALIGYLIGSIPSSYLSMRLFTGRDIRALGRGEATVTAVGKYAGKAPATVAAVAEFSKALICLLIAGQMVGELWASLVILTAAVYGSSWSIWLKGAGGQGQSMMSIGLLVLSPLAMAITAAFYLVPMAITRRHFLSNQLFHLAIPVVFSLWNGSWEWTVAGCLLLLPYIVKEWAPGDRRQAVVAHGVGSNGAGAS